MAKIQTLKSGSTTNRMIGANMPKHLEEHSQEEALGYSSLGLCQMRIA